MRKRSGPYGGAVTRQARARGRLFCLSVVVDELEILGGVLIKILLAMFAAEAHEPVGLARLLINIVDARAHRPTDFLCRHDAGLERILALGLG